MPSLSVQHRRALHANLSAVDDLIIRRDLGFLEEAETRAWSSRETIDLVKRLAQTRAMLQMLLTLPILVTCVGCIPPGAASPRDPALPPPDHAQVARLPHRDGLQYCADLRPGDLAPSSARSVRVHSVSVYVTSSDRNEPALLAIKGRHPGWETPGGTTIYQQPFTGNNSVWVEIDHEFPLPMICVEIYGPHVQVSHYDGFKNRMLLGFTYIANGHGWRETKFFKVSWGHYLPRFSLLVRPKH